MTEEPISKTRRKQAMHALQALGEALIELPPSRLAGLDLPETLVDALADARRIPTFEGRRRQMQYIGKLMRTVDPAPIEACIAAARASGAREAARHQEVEHWRDRLLADETALTELARRCPGADLQPLRALVRNARREIAEQRPPRAARELFRELRAALEAAPPPAA